MSGAFQVQPVGNSVAVAATTSAGASAPLFYDNACLHAAGTPTITQPTIFYVPNVGVYNVSLKISGNEQATPNGTPISVGLTSTRLVVLTPVPPVSFGGVESFNTRIGEVELDLQDILATDLNAGNVGAVSRYDAVAFFGVEPQGVQTVTGLLSVVADPITKAILTSLIDSLAAYGLIVDGTN